MALPLPLLQTLTTSSPAKAWKAIFDLAWKICSQPLTSQTAAKEVARRDREIADLDLFLGTAGWDLWASFESSVDRTADALTSWWTRQTGGKAILILDGLSLREAPWLLQGAAERDFTIHSARATAAELPAETVPFAKALGFASRAALDNNGAGKAHRFSGATTDCSGLHWADCIPRIVPSPQWVFWHHWPDSQLHSLASAGQGSSVLTPQAASELGSDAFWSLAERLTQGRQLVITSDHGYADSGGFPDALPEQVPLLKQLFSSGRNAPFQTSDVDAVSPFVPPVDLTLQSTHGRYRYALGRRKWKSPGGYPTLTHGGLSVLEVVSPFIEISR